MSHTRTYTAFSPSSLETCEVWISPVGLEGTLTLPRNAKATILFAHGSGSSRSSPRNIFVARELNEAGFATLLFDLLTEREAQDRWNVFDIPLLAKRLLTASEWIAINEATAPLPIAFFGASTGAAAALIAAAQSSREIAAIVSRGGRPDLVGAALVKVRSPTLLIVGGLDVDVLMLNRSAFDQLNCEKALKIVPGATHLFPEHSALEEVVRLAREWFDEHVASETKESV